jgi:hypothetical protein
MKGTQSIFISCSTTAWGEPHKQAAHKHVLTDASDEAAAGAPYLRWTPSQLLATSCFAGGRAAVTRREEGGAHLEVHNVLLFHLDRLDAQFRGRGKGRRDLQPGVSLGGPIVRICVARY